MCFDVVVENLHTYENWGVGLFESSHNALSVSDFAVHALHLVIVYFSSNSDFAKVFSSCFGLHDSEIQIIDIVKVGCPIRYQCLNGLSAMADERNLLNCEFYLSTQL